MVCVTGVRGATEVEQEMYVCVLEIRGKHLQILEIMAFIILNIQRPCYPFLVITSPFQQSGFASFPLLIGSSKADTRNDTVLSN